MIKQLSETPVRASVAKRTFMRSTTLLVLAGLLILPAACEMPTGGVEAAPAHDHVSATAADARHPAEVNKQLAALRAATARFHRLEEAMAAGYELLPGLDHCFTNQPVGDMGYHYIDASSLDLTVDLLHPEAMVYAPDGTGKVKLAAVEYIVPASAWDEVHASLPSLFGHEFHLNEALGVYVLHAWVWKHNPAGIFEDWNPTVTCD